MTVPEPVGAAAALAAPELAFTVLGCEPLPHAAAPTLRFSLAIDAGGAAVRSVMLEVQVRIAATQRGYSEAEQAQLGDLFGAAASMGRHAARSAVDARHARRRPVSGRHGGRPAGAVHV